MTSYGLADLQRRHSVPDQQADEPAEKPDRTPAGVLARSVLSVPHPRRSLGRWVPLRRSASTSPLRGAATPAHFAVVQFLVRAGGRRSFLAARYAQMGVGYHVIHDPLLQVLDDELRTTKARSRTRSPSCGWG